MPRPKSKLELQKLTAENYSKLTNFVNQLSLNEQESEFPPGTMNRNIRDVLMHLHHWHLLVFDWYAVGMAGQKPDMPAKGFTWKTTPALNKYIFEKYRNVDLGKAKRLLNESFQQMQDLIQRHSNEELFQKKLYKWTGSTSLGSYLISATSSHYDWAFKLIKKSFK